MRNRIPELPLFAITTVSILGFLLQDAPEQVTVQTLSPWLSATYPFVIGQPETLSDSAIEEIQVEVDVVVAGSFWTTYAVDIICHRWCKKHIGNAGVVNSSEIPYSSMAAIFGSLHRKSLNVSLPIVTDSKQIDACIVITPVYPTRYDKEPKINLKAVYQHQDVKRSAFYKALAFCAILVLIPWIQTILQEKSTSRSSTAGAQENIDTFSERQTTLGTGFFEGDDDRPLLEPKNNTKEADYEFVLTSPTVRK